MDKRGPAGKAEDWGTHAPLRVLLRPPTTLGPSDTDRREGAEEKDEMMKMILSQGTADASPRRPASYACPEPPWRPVHPSR